VIYATEFEPVLCCELAIFLFAVMQTAIIISLISVSLTSAAVFE